MNPNLLPILALAPYAAVALGLAVTLILFFSLKTELHRATRRERRRVDEALARLEEAQAPPAEAVSPTLVPASGVNLNRRVQAIRLIRKGEDVSRIAAILGVPRSEVELLVRVHNYVSERQAASAAAGN